MGDAGSQSGEFDEWEVEEDSGRKPRAEEATQRRRHDWTAQDSARVGDTTVSVDSDRFIFIRFIYSYALIITFVLSLFLQDL